MPFSSVLGASSAIKPGVCTSSTRPSSPYVGQLIFETDTNRLSVWNGSSWVYMVDADTPPGLELVKTQTIGTAVSSVQVTSAFSSTYDVYKVVVSGGSTSATCNWRLQLGSTTTGYYYAGRYNDYTGAGTGVPQGSNIAYWQVGNGSTLGNYLNCEITNPNTADETTFQAIYADVLTNGSQNITAGFLNNTTQYTDFTIFPSTGTATGGTIRVYGYRNS
jgi:hypothetical protein